MAATASGVSSTGAPPRATAATSAKPRGAPLMGTFAAATPAIIGRAELKPHIGLLSAHRVVARAAVEERPLARRAAQLSHPVVPDHHAVLPLGRLHRDQPAAHVLQHQLRLAVERVAP